MKEKFMRRAIKLAKLGEGRVNPNPMVGCVIVKDNEIIGEGYHEQFGAPHAERNALSNCIKSPKGATMYVTLEPCCHHGKTPPCTEAIIQSGISKVIIGSSDPNPLVAGGSIQILRKHNIEVVSSFLKEECDMLNSIFFHYIKSKTPYVLMKYAMTMDGKIATSSGKSRWITGEKTRERVHHLRHRFMSIMVGVGTVLSDDPMLTARIENARQPIRIICDSHLRTPIDSKIVTTASTYPTIIVTCSTENHQRYIDKGCQLIVQDTERIDLQELMNTLGEMKIDSVLLEGGSKLNASALQSRIVKAVQTHIAPKFFGGDAKSPIADLGIDEPNQAFLLSLRKIELSDEDIVIESEVCYCSPE